MFLHRKLVLHAIVDNIGGSPEIQHSQNTGTIGAGGLYTQGKFFGDFSERFAGSYHTCKLILTA